MPDALYLVAVGYTLGYELELWSTSECHTQDVGIHREEFVLVLYATHISTKKCSIFVTLGTVQLGEMNQVPSPVRAVVQPNKCNVSRRRHS